MTFRWPRFRRTSLSPVLEAGTLISVLVVTGGVLLFAELMEMVQGETRAFDRAMLLAFRNPMDLETQAASLDQKRGSHPAPSP